MTFSQHTAATRIPALVALGCALLTLASCYGPPPVNTTNGVDAPGGWVAQTQDAGEVGHGWVETFTNDDLTRIVREAVKQNYDVRAALARLDQSLATATIAGADIFPTVSAGYTGAKRQTLTKLRGASFGSDTFDRFVRSRSTTLEFGLDLSWEIDVWGRIRDGRSAAVADTQASAADFQAARFSVAAQAAQAWFLAIEQKMQLALAEKTQQSRADTLEIVQGRFDKGLVEAIDVHQARSDEAAAVALVESSKIAYQQAVRSLEVLLGRYPSGSMAVGEALLPVPSAIPVGVPSSLLERRPDLIAAERRVAAAVKRTSQAKAARLPRFTLTGSTGTSSDALRDIFDWENHIWNILLNLAQPVLDGGRLQAEVELNKGRADEAAANYAALALRAFQEVETALANDFLLALQLEALKRAADEADLALEKARERYSNGLDRLLLVLDTERRALTLRQQYITLQRQRLDNRVNLYLALGGDFDTVDLTPETLEDWRGDFVLLPVRHPSGGVTPLRRENASEARANQTSAPDDPYEASADRPRKRITILNR